MKPRDHKIVLEHIKRPLAARERLRGNRTERTTCWKSLRSRARSAQPSDRLKVEAHSDADIFAIEELTNIARDYLRPDVYRPRAPKRRQLFV
jgi:hypothetical protein